MPYIFKLARRLAKRRLAAALACLLSAACSDNDPTLLSPSSQSSTNGAPAAPSSATPGKKRTQTSRTVVGLRVTPDSVQIASGQSVAFSATAVFSDSSSDTVPVMWSVTGGTIDANGLFTAGASTGTFQVIARDSVLADTAKVVVSAAVMASVTALSTSDCSCCSYGYKRLVPVSTSAQLASALANALPGDKIALADGTYWRQGQWNVNRSGTADSPVLVCGTRRAVLNGGSVSTWSPLALSGARYWIFKGFTITNSKIGINVERSSDNVFDSLAIYNIGQEAIHLRKFSRRNVLQYSRIYNTGRASPGYGEGVYIGTAPNQWGTYTGGQPDRSDSNRVVKNVFGPGITSENIDIKSGTTGGVISGNVLSGTGYVAGFSSAAPVWVSVKGNYYTVAGNSGSDSYRDGFEVKVLGEAPGWGNQNVFSSNTANVDGPGYGFRIGSGTTGNVVRCSNVVTNAGAGFSNVACKQ